MLCYLKKTIVNVIACALLLPISNAYALISNGEDGALFIQDEVTFNVIDGQTFNFTTINIASSGILNLRSIQPNSSFSMLATGNVNIAGLLNIFTNTIIQAGGDIAVGTVDIKNATSLSLITDNRVSITGSVLMAGEPIPINTSSEITIGSPLSVIQPIVSNVPEPSSFALLVSGLALVASRKRQTQRR